MSYSYPDTSSCHSGNWCITESPAQARARNCIHALLFIITIASKQSFSDDITELQEEIFYVIH